MRGIPSGAGMLIYVLSRVEGGDPEKIVAKAKANNLGWISCRVIGIGPRKDPNAPEATLLALRDLTSREGILFGGWGYHTGLDAYNRSVAEKEAAMIGERGDVLSLDFYVANVEKEGKIGWSGNGWFPRKEELLRPAIQKLMAGARALLGDRALGLTTYRFPSVHPSFVWDSARRRGVLDFDMPQIYTLYDYSALGPANSLSQSLKEYRALNSYLQIPMVPIISVYPAGSWKMSPVQIVGIAGRAKVLGCPGMGGYAWDYCSPEQWETIAASWPGSIPKIKAIDLPDAKWREVVVRSLQAQGIVDKDGYVVPSTGIL